jgi:hypothetical protein
MNADEIWAEKAVPADVESVTVWCVSFAALNVLGICVHLCPFVVIV